VYVEVVDYASEQAMHSALSWHGDGALLLRLQRDSSITGEKHMASLRFVVRAVIGSIGIRVPCKTIADADADAIAVEM
jgi:hypothetical protein